MNELLSLDYNNYIKQTPWHYIHKSVDDTRHTVKIEVEHQSGIIKLIMAGFLHIDAT